MVDVRGGGHLRDRVRPMAMDGASLTPQTLPPPTPIALVLL